MDQGHVPSPEGTFPARRGHSLFRGAIPCPGLAPELSPAPAVAAASPLAAVGFPWCWLVHVINDSLRTQLQPKPRARGSLQRFPVWVCSISREKSPALRAPGQGTSAGLSTSAPIPPSLLLGLLLVSHSSWQDSHTDPGLW